jgi:hypothetical protein
MEKPIGIKYADAIVAINPNFTGNVIGDTEEELEINWNGINEISIADIKAKITEMESAEAADKQAQVDLKASAKAKLIAGEALTEEEANVLVGV